MQCQLLVRSELVLHNDDNLLLDLDPCVIAAQGLIGRHVVEHTLMQVWSIDAKPLQKFTSRLPIEPAKLIGCPFSCAIHHVSETVRCGLKSCKLVGATSCKGVGPHRSQPHCQGVTLDSTSSDLHLTLTQGHTCTLRPTPYTYIKESIVKGIHANSDLHLTLTHVCLTRL